MAWQSRPKLATALEEQPQDPWQGSWPGDHTCLLQGWRWLGRAGKEEGTSSPEKWLEEEMTLMAWVRAVSHSSHIWISLLVSPERHVPAAKWPTFPRDFYLEKIFTVHFWHHQAVKPCMCESCVRAGTCVPTNSVLHSCAFPHHYRSGLLCWKMGSECQITNQIYPWSSLKTKGRAGFRPAHLIWSTLQKKAWLISNQGPGWVSSMLDDIWIKLLPHCWQHPGKLI